MDCHSHCMRTVYEDYLRDSHPDSMDSDGLRKMEEVCETSHNVTNSFVHLIFPWNKKNLFCLLNWQKNKRTLIDEKNWSMNRDDYSCENGTFCNHMIDIRLFRYGICFCCVFSLDRIRRRCPLLTSSFFLNIL